MVVASFFRKRWWIFAASGVPALALAAMLFGFVPRVLVIPDYLHDTVVEDDIRHEIRRSRRLIRILARNQYDTGRVRRALVFPGELDRNGENFPRAVKLVPQGDRTRAIKSALGWLNESSAAGVILAVAGTDTMPEYNGDLSDEVKGLLRVELERPGEAELSARRILGETRDSAADYGILVIAGEFGPEIVRALAENAAEAVPRIVVELFLAHSGSRLREAGIPLSGAIVSDLAGILRSLPLRLKKRVDGTGVVHVPTVFFRY